MQRRDTRAEVIAAKLGDCLLSVGIAADAGAIVDQVAQAAGQPAATLFARGVLAQVLAAATRSWSG